MCVAFTYETIVVYLLKLWLTIKFLLKIIAKK